MSAVPPRSQPPTVVVLENDSALLQALRFMLMSEGFRVEACECAQALLALELPDGAVCLVVDERLPDGSGLETVAALRARGVAAPAVLITTNPEPALKAAAIAAKVDIVEKPLVGDTLLGMIRALLDRAGRP